MSFEVDSGSFRASSALIGGNITISGAGPTTFTVPGSAATFTFPATTNTLAGLAVTPQAFPGINNFTNATASTSTSTGAVVVTGGMGVGGSIYVGASLSFGTGGVGVSEIKLYDSGATQYGIGIQANEVQTYLFSGGHFSWNIGSGGIQASGTNEYMRLTATGLVIGNAGAVQGNLVLAGVTSGTTTIAAAAAASGTLTLPAGSTNFTATGGSGQYGRQNTVGGALTVSGITTAQSTPGNPAGTTNLTGRMMGLAGAITPVTSGKILIIISGDTSNDTILDGASVQIRYGTGAAPVNGDALTGTAVGGNSRSNTAVAGELMGFSIQAIVSGLTLSTAYWIDVGLAAITGGTASMADVSISIVEL